MWPYLKRTNDVNYTQDKKIMQIMCMVHTGVTVFLQKHS